MNNDWLLKDFKLIEAQEIIRHRNELLKAKRSVDGALRVNFTKKLYNQSKLLEDLIVEANKELYEIRSELKRG